jgi:hypothetical protein
MSSNGLARLTWAQVASFRVRWQHVEERAPAGEMLAVAARIGGLHLSPSFGYGFWHAAPSNYGHWLRSGWLRASDMTAREHQRLSAPSASSSTARC